MPLLNCNLPHPAPPHPNPAGYAKALPATQLATGKSVVLGSLALGSLVAAAVGLVQSGQEVRVVHSRGGGWLLLCLVPYC